MKKYEKGKSFNLRGVVGNRFGGGYPKQNIMEVKGMTIYKGNKETVYLPDRGGAFI